MIKTNYDFIVVGAGAAGSVLAAELSASGAQVLVIESGVSTTHRRSRTRASGFTTSVGRSTTAARPAVSAIEQSDIQHGPRTCPGGRQQHQRVRCPLQVPRQNAGPARRQQRRRGRSVPVERSIGRYRYGVHGLRVADASVMPRIITGPTNAPTHMIAGRASRLILGLDA